MTKKDAVLKIQEAIEAVQEMERTRATSIAITHLETADLWIRHGDDE